MAGASSTHNKEEQEVAVVLLPHALVEPRAVVIEPRHAHVAHPAVLRPRRPEEKKTGKPKKKKDDDDDDDKQSHLAILLPGCR